MTQSYYTRSGFQKYWQTPDGSTDLVFSAILLPSRGHLEFCSPHLVALNNSPLYSQTYVPQLGLPRAKEKTWFVCVQVGLPSLFVHVLLLKLRSHALQLLKTSNSPGVPNPLMGFEPFRNGPWKWQVSMCVHACIHTYASSGQACVRALHLPKKWVHVPTQMELQTRSPISHTKPSPLPPPLAGPQSQKDWGILQ